VPIKLRPPYHNRHLPRNRHLLRQRQRRKIRLLMLEGKQVREQKLPHGLNQIVQLSKLRLRRIVSTVMANEEQRKKERATKLKSEKIK
jgi:hypothetical protein